MRKLKICKFVSLLLVALMVFGSMQEIVWASEPQDALLLPHSYEVYVGDGWEWEARVLENELQLSGHYDYAYSVLTSTLNGSVGMQGFEGKYAISCPDEIVEIIVQFVTPPAVALRLMDEMVISPQRVGRALSGGSFEEQALSAHDLFSQQLGSIPVPFGSGRNALEIFSEHHRLFNGVFMRVPGYMVGMIAALPEVFAVTPNVAFYTLAELEQRQSISYLQYETMLYDNFYTTSTVNIETQDSPFFINPDFMRTVREDLYLNYIHIERGITGAGVRVAVVDTGIYHGHEEFERFLDPATGRIRGGERYDNTLSDNTSHFSRSHGTTVSGAVIGVAPNIELWHYRVALVGSGGGMNTIAGVEAAHEDGMDVINMSFAGSNTVFDPLSQIVNLAALDGIVMVAGAGNSGNANFTVSNPGNAPLSIAVGAGHRGGIHTDSGDTLTSYSSRGPTWSTHHIKPDVIAPTSVVTTAPGRGNYTTNASGTSHAAPIVAGIAALLIEAFPDETATEIKARIMNTTRPLADDINSVFAIGAGFVRPNYALNNEAIVTVEHYVPIFSSPSAPFELATMSSLSFGAINLYDGESMNSTMPLSIRNADTDNRIYTISYMFTSTPSNAVSINLSNTSVTVAPNSTGQIYVSMIIANDASAGLHGGYIYVKDDAGGVVARLPFGAVARGTTTVRVYTETQLRDAIEGCMHMPRIIELADSITLTPNRRQDDNVFNTLIDSFQDITIRSAANGPMRTITSDNNSPRTFLANGNLTLENIKITRAPQVINTGYGIQNSGNLTMLDGAIISGHSVGVYNMRTFTMIGGEISGNNNIGSIYITTRGGGVRNGGNFNMYGGIITDNSADMGGGVYSPTNLAFNMHGGIISGNTATLDGGGITISGGHMNTPFNMHGGVISGNIAYRDGGGIAIRNMLPFNIYGDIVSDNKALNNGGGISIGIHRLRHGNFFIGPDVEFTNNVANHALNRLPDDDLIYYQHVHATQWSTPLTQGFNNIDIEYTVGTPIPTRVISVGTETALRQAVVNAGVVVPTIIELSADITLAQVQEPLIIPPHAQITLTNYGGIMRTLTAGGNYDVIIISNTAQLTLDGIRITRETNTTGRGITNNGILLMQDGIITGHNPGDLEIGGGVLNNTNAVFYMHDGIIHDNNGSHGGGGVFNWNSAIFNMHGGKISGNTAYGLGGGISNAGTFNMTDGAISNNTSGFGGGGVNHINFWGGTFYMSGGTISGNSSHWGGGLWQGDLLFDYITITPNAYIYNNTAFMTRINDQLNYNHNINANGRINPGRFSDGFDHAFNNHDIAVSEIVIFPRPVAISGYVRSMQDHITPVSNATVTAIHSDGTRTITRSDANGRYTFVNLPNGTYTIVANADGFDMYAVGGIVLLTYNDSVNANVYLPVGGTFNHVVIVNLEPKEATSGARVEYWGWNPLTNIGGNTWLFSFTRPHWLLITAIAPGFKLYEHAMDIPSFVNGNVFLNGIEFINIHLQPEPFSIRGYVRSMQDHTTPVGGATVTAIHSNGTRTVTTTDTNGRYSFANLPNGTYTIVVSANGFDTRAVGGIELSTQDSNANADIYLPVGGRFTYMTLVNIEPADAVAEANIDFFTNIGGNTWQLPMTWPYHLSILVQSPNFISYTYNTNSASYVNGIAFVTIHLQQLE